MKYRLIGGPQGDAFIELPDGATEYVVVRKPEYMPLNPPPAEDFPRTRTGTYRRGRPDNLLYWRGWDD